MINETEFEILSKRVAALENAVKSSLNILKRQNEVIQKLSEATAAVVKKMAIEFANHDKKEVEEVDSNE